MKGIKFKMKDGSFDYYDPLEEYDFKESDNFYTLHMAYLYDIPKEEVEYYEWYDVCEKCGYESCRNCDN